MKSIALTIAADLLRISSSGFAYPDEQATSRVRSLALGLLDSSSLDTKTRSKLHTVLQMLDDEKLRRTYMEIFLRGAVPVTESHTMLRFDAVPDVSAFYRAFGVVAKPGESPDSLMHELEFTAILCAMAEYARTTEQRSVTIDAIATFLDEHLSDFVRAIHRGLAEKNHSEYYQSLADIAEVAIEQFIQPVLKLERSSVTKREQ
ncbi:MAG: molecular chaperone TorD family protein [Bradyrhizobiaceae bacterium]|nr:molecular chaperone TorD family protein [Bradyrhizobiaceae bacterium]